MGEMICDNCTRSEICWIRERLLSTIEKEKKLKRISNWGVVWKIAETCKEYEQREL